jgi:hypothetical protein
MTAEQHTERVSAPFLTRNRKAAILALTASGMIASTFLPWSHISGSATSYATGSVVQFSGLTYTGVQGDGVVCLVIGAICLITAACRTKWSAVPGILNVILGLMILLRRNTGGLTGGENAPGIGLQVFVPLSFVFTAVSLTLWKKDAHQRVVEAPK